jgi:hypothetical protein
MIDKSPVRVGSTTAVEPNSQLPMFRQFITFECSLEYEYIKVYYKEWLESGTAKLQQVIKYYTIKDLMEVGHTVPATPAITEIGHTVPGDPNAIPPTLDTYVIDSPAVDAVPSTYVIDNAAVPEFSQGWYFKKVKATSTGLSIGGNIVAPLNYEINFGKDIIVNVINMTLIAMPFDAPNEYNNH